MTEFFTNLKDSGRVGRNFEANLKEFLGLEPTVSGAGKIDLYHFNHANTEIKSGSGVICEGSEFKPWKNSTMVIYCPIVNEELPINKQEAFVIRRDIFVKILENLNLCKYDKGRDKWNINTLWVRSTNSAHGTKIWRLLDLLYENMECTLEEWFDGVTEISE